MSVFRKFEQEIKSCTKCKRLRSHCLKVAKEKRRAYMSEEYYGLPLPGFGDQNAKLHILGLAPAAHGANRTGRVFTGDRSGEWLYRALFEAGFSNQKESMRASDSLKLQNAYISCVVRCAPPQNKPTPQETKNCIPYLVKERMLLKNATHTLCLGAFSYQEFWKTLGLKQKKEKFSHGKKIVLENRHTLWLSYHPSQQNTFTGKLKWDEFLEVFKNIKKNLG